MTARLLLVRHAPTAATRRAAFAGDGALTARGREAAARAAGRLPRVEGVAVSPARCATGTAAALGVGHAATLEPALADWDFGAWRGRALDDLRATEPGAVDAWLSDPGAAPHGGERLLDVLARAAAWLAGVHASLLAITHAAVVRACVVAALGAPPRAFWAIDVAPLSLTELRRRDGRWRVARVNGALA